MNEKDILTEILDQVGDRPIESAERTLYERVATIADIAWQALAGPPTGERYETMMQIAREANCRSEKPRTILRRLLRNAQEQHGYVPGEKVRKAAGLATPRIS